MSTVDQEAAEYRVRVWAERELRHGTTVEPVTAAREAAAGDPNRAVTVETDKGSGPVVVLVLGEGGDPWHGPAFDTTYDATGLTLRVWDMEQESFEPGPVGGGGEWILREVTESLAEAGIDSDRLLTAGDYDDTGQPQIWAVGWYSPSSDPEDDE